MAKRMIQVYTKQSQNSFSQPIKIGSSAQYVTMEENNEEAETLKSYCNRIGDPKNLTSNKNAVEQRKLVDILNETSQTANQAYTLANGGFPDNSIGQEKLKNIVFTVPESNFSYNPPISSNTSLATIFGNIVKWLQDLKNLKLSKAGGEIEGQLFSNYFIGAQEGIGIRNNALKYRDSQGVSTKTILEYNNETELTDIESLYQYKKTDINTNSYIEYYKYGDGRLITIVKRKLSLSLNSSTVNSNYKIGSYYFNNSDYPIAYISAPNVFYSIIEPTSEESKISTYSLSSSSASTPGVFEIINLCGASSWTGTVIIRAEGRWK